MRALLRKSKNLMRDKHNSAGVLQADKALRAVEQPRRQTTQEAREEEEQALRQMITGIIPEWQEDSDKGKRSTIQIMKLWTGDLMNLARIQMKNWIEEKNKHKAYVQKRWDNRGIMKEAFQRWKIIITHVHRDEEGGKERKKEK
eukprot:4501698-Pleurochrysis_carterae.AAC.1